MTIWRDRRGFTLVEILVVILIAGVLAAIAAPGWFRFMADRRVNAGIDKVHLALREAQSQAVRTKRTWQASFREENGVVQWAVHPDEEEPGPWNNLNSQLQFGDRTTLRQAGGLRRARFNHRGWVKGQLGRVTLEVEGSEAKRCVFVSTLLGALRRARGEDCEE